MARPSPSSASRSSYTRASPERNSSFLSDFLSEDRNSALSHREAIEAAQIEHDRVREAAIRAFEMHTLEEQCRKIELQQREEKERLRLEAAVLAEEKRLRELRAQSIPKLPPEPEPEPKPGPPRQAPPQAVSQSSERKQPDTNGQAASASPVIKGVEIAKGVSASTAPSQPAPSIFKASPASRPTAPNPFASAVKTQPNGQLPTNPVPVTSTPAAPSLFANKQPNPFSIGGAAQTQQSITNPLVSGVPQAAAKPASSPPPDRYSQIHKELKKLRQNVVARSKSGPLKGKLGEMRRDIRKSIGQLTDTKGANATPLGKILSTLRESLNGSLPSQPVDVALFVVEPREPHEGSALNGAQLPSLFIYLLNMLAKAIISQFINECSAKPETADPIGVITAQIFSQKDFQWRGGSLIDVLMAKMRVICPVLFGHRASDKTAAGRATLGWRQGVDERLHNNRMIGLGTGYASIALRDFSKSKNKNPFPPANYWTAMARILNTPPEQISDTQLTVLKAMIDGHEQRFITFYGTAAMAALRVAVVDFPARAPNKTPPVGALVVLGQVLKRDRGLNLVQ